MFEMFTIRKIFKLNNSYINFDIFRKQALELLACRRSADKDCKIVLFDAYDK